MLRVDVGVRTFLTERNSVMLLIREEKQFMLRRIISNWWIVNMRGMFAVAFGVLTLFLAGRIVGEFGEAMTIVSVLALFVLYLIAYAALSIVAAMRDFGHSARWWMSLIHAAFLSAFASWALFSPRLTMVLLLYFMIAHSLLVGTVEVVFARTFRKHPVDQFLLGLAACVSLMTGTVLYLARNADVENVIRAIGLYTISFGVVMVLFSVRLHGFRGSAVHLAHPH